MLPFALALLLHGTPFPLPAVDGKALSVTEKQKTFRLPMRFEKVRAFYDGQLGKERDVAVKLSGAPGARVLTLSSKRKGDRWTKATVREGELETVIDVTPVVEVSEVEVSGNGSPLVQFVFGRSKEVDKAVEQTKDPLTR